ncbi:hypothetical protein [Parvibaculum sp.]|uniref:hypothetical protein n=1 Tax=Parvibaculum sp. TaxID=2024848 RepID=UPI00349FEBA7
MDDILIARVLHVLAIVHWIGGVMLVTAVILPAVIRFSEPARRVALFEEIEGRFSFQAKFSVTLAGLSGFYMTWRLEAWARFSEPQFWWMHAMVLVWAIFSFVLFVAEPLFLHDWFRRRAAQDPDAIFALVQRGHWILLTLSAVTIAGAVLGGHGGFLF